MCIYICVWVIWMYIRMGFLNRERGKWGWRWGWNSYVINVMKNITPKGVENGRAD